ncbi:MAG: RES family NAD+ phosphorylase [Gallionellaceae bacterium]|nr:RES family NAD+ phosphorylase [Gallionellaceae bacterium]
MIVWRISNYLDLSGQGGLRASARWHNAGVSVVYTASSPASALLEVLVHLELDDVDHLPDSYQLLRIAVPDSLPIAEVEEENIDPDWRKFLDMTRAIGDKWLRESNSALLAVPSAIVPHTKNYLINPAHRDTKKIKINSHGSFPFDFRLFQ